MRHVFALMGLLVLCACGGEHESRESSEDIALAPVLEGRAQHIVTEPLRFEPPAKKSAIPSGSWICDMGTIHYARPDEGNGECPVCGMDLVQHTHD